MEVRYYSKTEYNKLSKAQRKRLHDLRKKKNNQSTASNADGKSEIAALRQEISEENRLVAAINTQPSSSPTSNNPLSNPLNQRSQS